MIFFCSKTTTVPSILGKRRRRKVSMKPSKIVTWDREVICLPHSYMKMFSTNGVMPIPRKKKDILASFGLVGRLHLESDWSESEVITEIRSTFSENVTEDIQFQFLQFIAYQHSFTIIWVGLLVSYNHLIQTLVTYISVS